MDILDSALYLLGVSILFKVGGNDIASLIFQALSVLFFGLAATLDILNKWV